LRADPGLYWAQLFSWPGGGGAIADIRLLEAMSGRCSLDVNASATRFAMAHCNTVCACFGPVFSGKSLHRSNFIQTPTGPVSCDEEI
jgi:hypothetical protein